MQNFIVVRTAGKDGREILLNTERIVTASMAGDGVMVTLSNGSSLYLEAGSLKEFQQLLENGSEKRFLRILSDIYFIMKARLR